MSWDNQDQLGIELTGGKAAVGVLANDEKAGIVARKLAELGGAVELVEVTAEALDAATVAAEAAPETAPEAPAATGPGMGWLGQPWMPFPDAWIEPLPWGFVGTLLPSETPVRPARNRGAGRGAD